VRFFVVASDGATPVFDEESELDTSSADGTGSGAGGAGGSPSPWRSARLSGEPTVKCTLAGAAGEVTIAG
jgi:hypothetical protein